MINQTEKGVGMTFIDLFSGIGGFRRGLERSGHRCVGHVEIDKYANKSYCAMYGLIPCKYHGDTSVNSYMVCDTEVSKNCDGKNCNGEWYAKDVKSIRAGEIPKAEIWTFGFPCTDISIAGRMAGLHGERSGLFFTVIGLLKSQSPENKPPWLIVENVKHLVSSERGGVFTTVLSELWEAGYACQWAVVNSKDFGVPQHRERVYIVGYLRGQCTGKIFPVGGANSTPIKQILGKTQGNRLYDPSGLSVTLTANGGGFAGRTGMYTVSVNRKDGLKHSLDTAHTLTASDARGINRNQDQNAVITPKPPCTGFIDLSEQPRITEFARCIKARQYAGITHHKGETSGVFLCHGSPDCARAVLTPGRAEKRQNGRRFKEPGEPEFTLTTQDVHGIMLCCCEGWQGSGENGGRQEIIRLGNVNPSGNGINGNVYDSKGICPALTTNKGEGTKIALPVPCKSALCCRIRRLTPREAWRLQAFEDDLFDRARAAGISDAQLYKQAGNAVTVNVVYEIGRKLKALEGGVSQ